MKFTEADRKVISTIVKEEFKHALYVWFLSGVSTGLLVSVFIQMVAEK